MFVFANFEYIYLYNKVEKSKVDIVGFNIFDVKKNKTIKCRYFNEILHQPILFESIFINYYIEDYTIWNKLIKKEIFLNAYEDFKSEISKWKWNYFEDDIWNILVHRNAKSKISFDKLVYIYNSNNNS